MRFVVFVLVMIFTGCAQHQLFPSSQPQKQESPLRLLPTIISSDRFVQGAKLIVQNQISGEKNQAVVGRQYFSALGSRCYRLEMQQGNASSVASSICQSEDGSWVVVPPLQLTGEGVR
jgi:hypothetical protein